MCLGADTRATGGPIVADKNCEKVRFLELFFGMGRGARHRVSLPYGAPSRQGVVAHCLASDSFVFIMFADHTPLQIHYIANHIRCCGAGTAADTEFVTNLISSNIEVSPPPPPTVAVAISLTSR